MTSWGHTIEAALLELGQFLRASDWYGRENELVNLFAHSFLAGRTGPNGTIQAGQLGIEVAVKQLSRAGGKALVRKDLVVWNKTNETVWAKKVVANDPAAIIEFKVNDNKKCTPDLVWLRSYTKLYSGVVGFSVCAFVKESRGVSFVRITGGESAAPIFVLPSQDAQPAAPPRRLRRP